MLTSNYKCKVCNSWYDGEFCENCGYVNTHNTMRKERRKSRDGFKQCGDTRKIDKRP